MHHLLGRLEPPVERLGRAQCSRFAAPSSATGTSSLRRTRASISRRIAALRGASR